MAFKFAALRLQFASENVIGIAQLTTFANDEFKLKALVAVVTAASGTALPVWVPLPALPAVITLPPFVADTCNEFAVNPVALT
jgi:hypothetical protein